MSWMHVGAAWLPTGSVVAMTILALSATLLLPPGARARLVWAAAIILFGCVSIVATLWQQAEAQAALEEQTALIQTFWSRLEMLSGLLPKEPETSPEEIFDAATAAIGALHQEVVRLRAEVKELRTKYNTRTVDDQAVAKMKEFLGQYGRHRVVISCVPGDVEAFTYANQLANILREAGWDAPGPEPTAIFGAGPAMGINLYVRGPRTPDAARILLDAFAKFNIPYQSRVAPNAAIPDAETVELFVGAKP